MTAKIPEAVRLADCLERDNAMNWPDYDNTENAAAELRRQHAEIERLTAELEALRRHATAQDNLLKQVAYKLDAKLVVGPRPVAALVGEALELIYAAITQAVPPVETHAELRKTWKKGQTWQARENESEQWSPGYSDEPWWVSNFQYRQQP
jgi:hypothetical protein